MIINVNKKIHLYELFCRSVKVVAVSVYYLWIILHNDTLIFSALGRLGQL